MNRLIEELVSALFPRACPLCRSAVMEERAAFCPACLAGFETIPEPVCPRCGAPLEPGGTEPQGALCAACLAEGPDRSLPLSVRSLALYAGNVREAILRVKFGKQRPVARSLGLYIIEQFPRFFPADAFDLILPVPLHPIRLREREFNQSVLLARPLAGRLRIPLELDAAVRVRHTPPQSALTEADRRRNLGGAFRVRRPERIRGRSILLLDDVYTTGATLEELARTLLSAGARKVSAITLARTKGRVTGDPWEPQGQKIGASPFRGPRSAPAISRRSSGAAAAEAEELGTNRTGKGLRVDTAEAVD